MSKKGISPLIATVLVIAITMTLAGIISFWTTSFVRKQVQEFEKETEARECQFANFRVFKCSYDEANGKISLILENIKNVDLKNVTAFIIYANGSVLPEEGYLLGELKGNTLKTFEIQNVSAFSSILITTHCPSVRVETTC